MVPLGASCDFFFKLLLNISRPFSLRFHYFLYVMTGRTELFFFVDTIYQTNKRASSQKFMETYRGRLRF